MCGPEVQKSFQLTQKHNVQQSKSNPYFKGVVHKGRLQMITLEPSNPSCLHYLPL